MDTYRKAKSAQEQLTASWVEYLKTFREEQLAKGIAAEEGNFKQACTHLREAVANIDELIDANRGGERGLHGYIAEAAQVGVENARKAALGQTPDAEWINNNGMADMLRAEQLFQLKFCNARGLYSLDAIAKFLEKYPDYLEQHGKFIIPADHYEAIRTILEMPQAEAAKLTRSGDAFSYSKWKAVHAYFDEKGFDLSDIEPAAFDYDEVQVGAIHEAMEKQREQVESEKSTRIDAAVEDSKPTVKEGAAATAAAAATEGIAAFAIAVMKKRDEGKAIKDFTEQDWADIAKESGYGAIKGGVRGATVYVLTNYTDMHGQAASALVTASFGIAEQAHRYRTGEIDKETFIANSEKLCIETAVTTTAAILGKAAIPAPIVGPMLANSIATSMLQIGESLHDEYELLAAYAEDQRKLDDRLADEYQAYIDELNVGMHDYLKLIDKAFAPNVDDAFAGSIALAQSLGVDEGEIINSREEALAYFME